MTKERKLIIEQLMSHPEGVGSRWSWQIVRELLDALADEEARNG